MDNKKLEKLAVEVKNGNTEAFRDIYIIMYNPLYRLIYRTVKDEALTQDIIQDTFVSAIENIWTLRNPSMISSWLFSISANRCKDVLKKKTPSLFSEFEDYQIDNIEDKSSDMILANSVESSNLKDMINEILDLMPADNRLCLLMKYQEGMPVKSIAAALEISESTVKGRLLRARNQVKKEVTLRRKKGKSVFSFAPWLLFIRFLKQGGTAGLVSTAAAEASFAQIMSSAGTASAGSAAAAATAAGASSSATAVTAVTAAKIAVASGVVQKAVIGVVSAAIVTASTTAAITITEQAKEHKSDAEATTSAYNSTSNLVYAAEEPNAAIFNENEEDIKPIPIQESNQELNNFIEPTIDKTNDVLNSKVSEQENTSSISNQQTIKADTTASSSTSTTVQKSTTTKATIPTTAKMTVAASNATVAVTLKNEDGSTRKINLSFKPGEVINQSTVYDKLYDQYDIDALVVVTETTAEAGKTYTATAY